MSKQPSTLSFNSFDCSCIVVNLLIYRLFTRIPTLFPKTAGTAAALSAAFSAVLAFGLAALIVSAFLHLPKINIFDAAEWVFGILGRKIVVLIVLLYLAVSAIVALGEFSELTKLISFPTAPTAFCALFFIIATIVGAFGGFSAISRLHRIFVPITLFVLFVIVISTLWNGDFSNLFPVLGRGAESVFGKGISGVIMYTDLCLLFLISPTDKSAVKPEKSILASVLFGIFTVALIIFAYNVRIPYPISAEGQFPIYLLLKEIHYGRFFQRIDAILLMVATLSGMLYLALNLLFFTNTLKTDFGLSDAKPCILPVALTLFFSSAGVKFIPAELLETLLFCSGFAVWAVFLLVIFFTKVRRKQLNEKA